MKQAKTTVSVYYGSAFCTISDDRDQQRHLEDEFRLLLKSVFTSIKLTKTVTAKCKAKGTKCTISSTKQRRSNINIRLKVVSITFTCIRVILKINNTFTLSLLKGVK